MASSNSRFGMKSVPGLAAGLFLIAAPAWAQVVPPPPEAPAKTPEFTPPPASKAPASAPKGAAPAANSGAAESKPRPMIRDQVQRGEIKLPDGFDVNVLVKYGTDGKLVKYDRPLPWMAFDANMLISDEQREALKPMLARREMQHEMGAVNNLDIMIKVEGGEFDRLDPRDRPALGWADRAARVLRSAGMLSETLSSQGHLTAEQAAACQMIGTAYGKAMLEEVRLAAGDDKTAQVAAITRELYKGRVDEPLYVYRGLLLRAAAMPEEALNATEMSEEVRASLAAEVAAVKAASTDDQRRAAVTALLLKMPDWVMQHQFLDQVIRAKYPNRASVVDDKRQVTPLMAYQVEKGRRLQAEADAKAKAEAEAKKAEPQVDPAAQPPQ